MLCNSARQHGFLLLQGLLQLGDFLLHGGHLDGLCLLALGKLCLELCTQIQTRTQASRKYLHCTRTAVHALG